MYFSCLSGLIFGTLFSAQLCSSYAITTTILLDVYQLAPTEAASKASSSSAIAYIATSSKSVYGLKQTTTTAPTWSNTTATSISSSDASLLPFPLSASQSSALSSLLSLVSSIPDEILQAGNLSAHAFFTNVSSCLTNQTNAIQKVLSHVVPALENAATSIEGRLTAAVVPLATSLAGDLTSAVAPAITAAASAIENGANGIASHATAILPAITSLAAPIENGAEAIGQGLSNIFKVRAELQDVRNILKKRSELGDVVSELSTLGACLSNAVDSNSIFKVGDCAFELAELAFPLARLAKLKRLVSDVGGVEKAVKTVVEAKSVVQAVGVGGKQVLDLIKEVSGVNDVVKACKFLV